MDLGIQIEQRRGAGLRVRRGASPNRGDDRLPVRMCVWRVQVVPDLGNRVGQDLVILVNEQASILSG